MLSASRFTTSSNASAFSPNALTFGKKRKERNLAVKSEANGTAANETAGKASTKVKEKLTVDQAEQQFEAAAWRAKAAGLGAALAQEKAQQLEGLLKLTQKGAKKALSASDAAERLTEKASKTLRKTQSAAQKNVIEDVPAAEVAPSTGHPLALVSSETKEVTGKRKGKKNRFSEIA